MSSKGAILKMGEFLKAGEYLTSENNQFFACMQYDGNFCIYKGTPENNQGYVFGIQNKWRKKPTGTEHFAVVQTDGNFCVYQGTNGTQEGFLFGLVPMIQRKTPQGNEFFGILEDDGNFVVYAGHPDGEHRYVWSTEIPRFCSFKNTNGQSLVLTHEGKLEFETTTDIMSKAFEVIDLRSNKYAIKPFYIEEDNVYLAYSDKEKSFKAIRFDHLDQHGTYILKTNSDQFSKWTLQTQSNHVLFEGLEAEPLFELDRITDTHERNCCGQPSHHDLNEHGSRRLQWNEETHHELVDTAMQIIHTHYAQQGEARRLLQLWENPEFRNNVYSGLRDADIKVRYKGIIFCAHFYDPDLHSGLVRITPNINALKSCEQYANSSVTYKSHIEHGRSTNQEYQNAGYELGLALHYLTDLSQPMHAANFANLIGYREGFSRKDWRHAGFEDYTEANRSRFKLSGDEFYSRYGFEVIPKTTDTFAGLAESLARDSKQIFLTHVLPEAKKKKKSRLNIDNRWGSEADVALSQCIPLGQKYAVKFLLYYAGR